MVSINHSFNGWLVVGGLSKSDASFLLESTKRNRSGITQTGKSLLGQSLHCILLPFHHMINGVGYYLESVVPWLAADGDGVAEGAMTNSGGHFHEVFLEEGLLENGIVCDIEMNNRSKKE